MKTDFATQTQSRFTASDCLAITRRATGRILSIGQIGQIIGKAHSQVPHRLVNLSLFSLGVYIFKTSEAPGYPTGHYTNAAFLIEGALVVILLRWIYIRRNKALLPGERPWRL